MNDQSKTKQIQIQEPDALRQRIEELQQAELAWKREKEELKEIEKKYRLLADNISDVIFVLDMNLNYTYVSPSVKPLRGFEPEEVLKQSPMESLVPASRELALKSLSEVMELEKFEHRDISISRTLQLELKRKDGTTVWTEVHFSFIRDEDQRPVGILGITRDITERKLVETTQDRLLYILEANLNEIYAFDSESLAFEYVNRGALMNLGYTLEDMRRMTPLDLKPAFTEETFRQTIQPLLQHKQEQLIFETTHKRADGSLYPAEVHLQMVELGKQRLFLAMIVDISERKAAEAEQRRTEEFLRESEAILSRAQEIAHIGSWKLDLTTNHLTWSDEVYRIFGCQPQEFAATYETFLDFTHPDDRTAVDEAYSRSLRDGSDSYEIEHRIVRLGAGDVRYVHERCVHTRDEAGTIIQSIGMVQDITERKRAEAALAEQIHELRRWHDVMLDREDRIIELKREVNEFLARAGQEERYKLSE